MIGSGKFWLGLVISVVLLALFALTVDLGRMADALGDANYVFLAPGLASYLVSIYFRTLRWQVLLQHLREIRMRRLFPVVVVGYMANNLLPMRLGEVVRSYYLGEREGISKTSSLATILVERVMDALTLLFFIAAIALFIPLGDVAEGLSQRFGVDRTLLVAALSVPFIVSFGVLLLFAIFPTRTRATAVLLIRRLPGRLEVPARGLMDMFLEGLVPLRSPRTLTIVFLLSVPIWIFEAGLFLFVGMSFGLDDVYDHLGELALVAGLVTAISNIGGSVPAAPGGIGLFELFTRETLVLLPLAAVDRSVAAGFAAVVHAVLLLSMIVLGQAFLWSAHISFRRLSQAGRAEESAAGALEQRGHEVVAVGGPAEGEDSA